MPSKKKNVSFVDIDKDTIFIKDQGTQYDNSKIMGGNNVFKKKGVSAF